MKAQKRDKSKFVTTFEEIIVMIIITYKSLSQIPYKIFAAVFFFY